MKPYLTRALTVMVGGTIATTAFGAQIASGALQATAQSVGLSQQEPTRESDALPWGPVNANVVNYVGG